MKSDALISKYLDGELSQHEDEQLRRHIAADPLLKSEFNSAVTLHIASRENLADSNLSDEEFLEVERLILARVRRPAPVRHSSNMLIISARRLAAAAILLITSVPIADMTIKAVPEIDSFTLNVPLDRRNEKPIVAERKNLSVTDKRHTNQIEYRAANMSGSNIAANLSEPPFEHNTNDSWPKSDAAFSYNSDAIVREYNDDGHENVQQSNSIIMQRLPQSDALKDLSQTTNIISDAALSLFDAEHSTEVQLTTFVSNGILKVGGNPAAVASSISQSIGYAVNMSGRIGLEVGLIGYSMTDGGKIATPIVGGHSRKGGVQGAENGMPKSPAQSEVAGEYETNTVTFTKNKTVYWGAAFYEQTLLDKDNLTLNARLGAGASPEGPMAYGRAFARYAVWNGIFLTLGAESRLQVFQSPMSELLRQETSTGVSVVYGIQAKF
ncbi:hypothetical protein MASR2M18_13970 [Ignavibacteria bacterium]|nr:zf-HC2 domain-containing protein [Bacteroidota bacterium]MCZ2133207.1 zf-HC2 domain-containing protein [Bacteroidota bacterium]